MRTAKTVIAVWLVVVGMAQGATILGLQGPILNNKPTYDTVLLEVTGVKFVGGSLFSNAVATGDFVYVKLLTSILPNYGVHIYPLPTVQYVKDTVWVLTWLDEVGVTKKYPSVAGNQVRFDFTSYTPYPNVTVYRAVTCYDQPFWPFGCNADGVRHGALIGGTVADAPEPNTLLLAMGVGLLWPIARRFGLHKPKAH